jgi:aspartyl-tRNA(Asn)/glutamyl-tRNA(Gln) amidotransferase subunit C
MNVDENLLKHVAKVARLKLTNDEIKEFLPQLKEVIKSFEEIQSVDTSKTNLSFHPIDIKNHIRDDVPKKSLSINDALKNTTHKKNNYFMGPKVI